MSNDIKTITAAPIGVERSIDPRTLVMATNVRLDATTDRHLVASIKQHGVLEPVTVTEGNDTTLTVKYGHRRTLAAIEAGLDAIPVRVVAADPEDAARIVTQLAENDHREGLNARDRRAAYAQLTGLGLTAAQIAKRTSRPKAEVEAATTASGSETATAALEKYQDQLSLMDAAAIAEFDDEPDTVKAILAAARAGESTEHVVQRARDERAERQARETAETALREQGVNVIEAPRYGDDSTTVELGDIRATRTAGRALTQAEHAECPGHAAFLRRSYDFTNKTSTYVPVWSCTDPKANGHAVVDRHSGSARGGQMSETEKAERRTVIANNKAWDSAEKVRGEWIEQFAKGTGKLIGAEHFIARAVMQGECSERALVHGATLAKIEKMTAPAATRHTVASIMRTWHKGSGRHTWRNPQERDRRMLAAMVTWGYSPAPIEKALLPRATRSKARVAK